jgi:REP element-mobilizing transposase RayT
MDKPHIEKTTRYYKQTGFVVELTGYEKKRKIKEYMEETLGRR